MNKTNIKYIFSLRSESNIQTDNKSSPLRIVFLIQWYYTTTEFKLNTNHYTFDLFVTYCTADRHSLTRFFNMYIRAAGYNFLVLTDFWEIDFRKKRFVYFHRTVIQQ